MRFDKKIKGKITKYSDKILRKKRIKKLNNTDFTIICNNCWGGFVYRRYGLPYLTPTVGLFFFADDFVKLCKNLKHYMECELTFIEREQSKRFEFLNKELFNNVPIELINNIPIGKIDDIEIVFSHYKTKEEALEKWNRRKERINYDNLIFKFSKMNCCTEKELDEFDKLDVKKKFCFVPYECERPSAIYFPQEGMDIVNDTIEYSRYVDLEKIINAEYVCGKTIK